MIANALGARTIIVIIATVIVVAIPCGRYLLRLLNLLNVERPRFIFTIPNTHICKKEYIKRGNIDYLL